MCGWCVSPVRGWCVSPAQCCNRVRCVQPLRVSERWVRLAVCMPDASSSVSAGPLSGVSADAAGSVSAGAAAGAGGQACPQLWSPEVVAPPKGVPSPCASPRRVAHECGVRLNRHWQQCGCLRYVLILVCVSPVWCCSGVRSAPCRYGSGQHWWCVCQCPQWCVCWCARWCVRWHSCWCWWVRRAPSCSPA